MSTADSGTIQDRDLRQRLLTTISSLQGLTTSLLPILMRLDRAATMSTSEKRRVPGAINSSPSRATRSKTASSTNTSPSKNMARSIPSHIAPPPRVALSGASSPAPEDRDSREGGARGSSSRDVAARTTATTASNAGQASTTPNVNLAAAAATSTLLREKDSRIAYLEQELAVMETEFQRELDKLSANESETASFWQAKHSALNQQFLRTDTELRLLRAEFEAREAERAEREDARRLLRERDKEVAELRAQVRGLKEWVSNSTRMRDGAESMTSDEVFADGMARLANGLQNWVIVHFRKANLLELGPVIHRLEEQEVGELARLVPTYEELIDRRSKINLLQSVVSKIFVEEVFGPVFVGLSKEKESEFREMDKFLSSFASASSPESILHWRSSTLSILKRDSHLLESETSIFASSLVSRIDRMLTGIADASPLSPSRDQGLLSLITTAIELSRLLAVQKAAFKVFMPDLQAQQSLLFDPATMEDIGGAEQDEYDIAEREICCVVFPGLVKRGNENGGQLQFRNVIAKARVLCCPE